MMHCMRCHESFVVNGKGGDTTTSSSKEECCVVEHDYDLFDGSRNGTQWYQGTLGCCGAYQRFHRHGLGEDVVDPKECYRGPHEADPNRVVYNKSTIKICSKELCGEALHTAAKEAFDKQREEAKREKEIAKRQREEERERMKAQIDDLKGQGKRREARKLRARMLGLDSSDEELDSDVDSEGCEEFDSASDSSLVPPWMIQD